MAACPKCGRTLSGSAKQCVYCGAGNSFKPRQQLKVPEGTLPKRRRGLPWGKILIVLIILVGIAVYFSPAWHDRINGWFAYLKSQF